jgi:hypothetical protein
MSDLNFDDIFGDLEAENAKYFEQDKIRAENVATKGNIHRGFDSAVDSLQGSFYGAAGIAGDALGIDAVRDWGFEGYQENQEEASLNPVDVQNFTDISTGNGLLETASDTGKWFAGTIGQLAPSVAESLITTVIGAAAGSATVPGVGTAAGAAAGFFGRKAAVKAIDNAVETLIARNIPREIAEKTVKEGIIKRANVGANTGMIAGTGAMEGGGMWGEDAEAHGVENANAGSAIGLGLISGASEVVSPGGMLIKRIAGIKGAGSEVADKVADTFLKRLGTEVPSAMGGEAAQEVFQSFLGVLNKKIQDPNIGLTDREAIFEYINSGAAGAAGGLVFGGVSSIAPEKQTVNPDIPPSVKPQLPPPPPANHTVGDVLDKHSANVAVESAVARQDINAAGPIIEPGIEAKTVGGVLGQTEGGYNGSIATETNVGSVEASSNQVQDNGVVGTNDYNLGYKEREISGLGKTGNIAIQQQVAGGDISRLDFYIKDMAKSLYPDPTKPDEPHINPDWIKLKTLKDWEKETGEDVKSFVSSKSAKETLAAVIAGEPLNEKQTQVWGYLKSVAENKAMVDEQGALDDIHGISGNEKPLVAAGTGDIPADFGASQNGSQASQNGSQASQQAIVPPTSQPIAKDQSLTSIYQEHGAKVAIEVSNAWRMGNEISIDEAKKLVAARSEVEPGTSLATNTENANLEADDERFTDMVKVLNNKGTVEEIDAAYQDMAGIFTARPELAGYQDRFKAARDEAAAKISPVIPNAERHEVIENTDSVAHGHEVNTAPSEAQAEAGNYKKAHVQLDGLDISIENPAGSTRSGKDKAGKSWQTEMKADYGYIKGSRGYDKDHVDVFMAPGYRGGTETAYIVDQYNDDGSFDEHKVVIGATSEADAMAIYNSNYEKGWTGGKSVKAMPIEQFKEWAKSDAPKAGPVKANNTPAASSVSSSSGNESTVSAPSGVPSIADRPGGETVTAPIDKFDRAGRDEKYGIDFSLSKIKDGFSLTEQLPIGEQSTEIKISMGGVFRGRKILNADGEWVDAKTVVQAQAGGGEIPSERMPFKPDVADRGALLELLADIEFARASGNIAEVDRLERILLDVASGVITATKAYQQKVTAPEQSEASAPSGVSSSSPEIIEHVTKQGKGKTIKGIVRKDITKAEAKAIDPYTFPKDGGFFIREKYLKAGTGDNQTSDVSTVENKPDVVPQESTSEGNSGTGSSPVDYRAITIERLGDVGTKVQFRKAINQEILTIKEIDKEGKVSVGGGLFRFANEYVKAAEPLAPTSDKIDGSEANIPENAEVKNSSIQEEVAKAKEKESTVAYGYKNPDGSYNFTEYDESRVEHAYVGNSPKVALDIINGIKRTIKNAQTKLDEGIKRGGEALTDKDRRLQENIVAVYERILERAKKVAGEKDPIAPPAAVPAETPQLAAKTEPDRFAGNKVFTGDMVKDALARLKARQATLNSGFNPLDAQDMFIIGGAYFESGIRKFTDWAKEVTAAVGNDLAIYLPDVYSMIRKTPGIDTEGMSSQEEVDAAVNKEKAPPKTKLQSEIVEAKTRPMLEELKTLDTEIEQLYQLRECLKS